VDYDLTAILEEFFSVTDKVAVVCGGGSGLGRATAIGLGEAGAKVVIFHIRDATDVVVEVKKMGAEAINFVVDVTDRASIEEATKKTLNKFGKIDILVNTAGITKYTNAENETLEQFQRILDVNVTGTFNTCSIIGKQMIKQRSGKIVNFGSLDGITVYPGTVSYNTSKAAVHHLTRSLAVEWIKYGINVNAVAPAFFDTPMNTEILKNKEWLNDFLKYYLPLGRVCQPREIVGTILFLCSKASDAYVGAVMDINGGSAIIGGWQE
jgi:NAD(P)-dependent dehydrogenase (short-subunit alcohol dehydrogenase family)